MKIGILTWHKVVNHGAVLQAYALQSYLVSLGHDVVILDYERFVASTSHLLYRIKRVPQKIIRIISGEDPIIKSFFKEKRLLFDLFRDKYLKEGESYDKESGLDMVFIGSDQVFDILTGYNPYMYGKNINCDRLYSYAPCAAQTTFEIISNSKYKNEILGNLKMFKGLSARDENTQTILRSIRPDLEIPLTIDPVLLYGFKKELKEWQMNEFLLGKKYIVIYAYHTYLDAPRETKYIVEYARKNHYLIVALGYHHPWCDISVNASPTEFLSIMNCAQKVVTDTFHGTVFSIICNTNFCTIIRDSKAGNSNKLGGLMSQFQLENRVAATNEMIYDILCKEMDWKETNQVLENLRDKSKEYINKCINR